jgi:excinuclease ABC subunit A
MHDIEIVVDRLVAEESSGEERDAARMRLTDSVETALRLGSGIVQIVLLADKEKKLAEEERTYSEHFACANCGLSIGELEPRNFSFNSPHGACRDCTGLGVKMELDPEMVIPNKNLSLTEGALQPWARQSTVSTWYMRMLDAVARKHHFSTQVPVRELSPEHLNISVRRPGAILFLQGPATISGTAFEVIRNWHRYQETDQSTSRRDRSTRRRAVPRLRALRLKPSSETAAVRTSQVADVHPERWTGPQCCGRRTRRSRT